MYSKVIKFALALILVTYSTNTTSHAMLRRCSSSLQALLPKPLEIDQKLLAHPTQLQDFKDQQVTLNMLLALVLQIKLPQTCNYIAEPSSTACCLVDLFQCLRILEPRRQLTIYPLPAWQHQNPSTMFTVHTTDGDIVYLDKRVLKGSPLLQNNELHGCLQKKQSLFNSKSIMCIGLLIAYLHNQTLQHGRSTSVVNGINEVGEAFMNLLKAGYNPAPLLHECIELAHVFNTPNLVEVLEGFRHNHSAYLAKLNSSYV